MGTHRKDATTRRRKEGLLRSVPRFFLEAGRYIGYDRAARIGCAAVRFAGLDRQAATGRARENLRLFFPDAAESWIERVVRELRANAIRARHFDKYFLPNLPDDELDRICQWVGDDRFRSALEEKRGVVVVSLHYGRYWAAPAWLTRHGARVMAFQVGEGRLPEPQKTLSDGTLRAGDLSAPLRAVRALRKGAVVCLQLDAGRLERPLVVSFLGHPTRVARSPLEIARLAGALVLPVLAIPVREEGADLVRITCYEPIDTAELPSGEPPEETMGRLLEPLERQVRGDPAQWFGIVNAHRRLAGSEKSEAVPDANAAADLGREVLDE